MAPQDLLSKHDLRPHEPACPRRNPRPSTRLLVHCHCFDGFAATLENGNASYESHCDSPSMAVVEAYPYVGVRGYAKVMMRTSAVARNVYLIALAGTSASGACA